MRIIGVILARLDSTRLPGKALCDVGGQPVINYVIHRARRVRNLSHLVIATSNDTVDDVIADHGEMAGLKVFRGSKQNVAARCLGCSKLHNADFFVRLNGDSPWVDPSLIEEAIDSIKIDPMIDLATNLVRRTFPYGISIEVVRTATLGAIFPKLDVADAEHVTSYFYRNQSNFRIHPIVSQSPQLAKARLTIDTPDDLERFRTLALKFGSQIELANYKEVAAAYLRLFND